MVRVPVPRALAMTMAPLDGDQYRRRQEQVFEELRDVLERRKDNQPLAETGPPVALRWIGHELLGFPTAPFEVFRMPTRFDEVIDLSTQVIGDPTTSVAHVSWGVRPLFALGLEATPAPGRTMVIDLLDEGSEPLAGQRRLVTTAGPQVFFVPGISGLRIQGGTFANPRGVLLTDLVNDGKWQRIDTVGLPFKTGEIGAPAYEPEPQGYEPADLSGLEASTLRLLVEAMLRLPPPPVGLSGVVTPDLPPPAVEPFLDALRDSNLERIAACIEDGAGGGPIHAEHRVDRVVDGIHQPGIAGPVDTARADLPTVATTLLTVSADSAAAVGLGYGTTDFPPGRSARLVDTVASLVERAIVLPPTFPIGPWLYMVAAPFDLPFVGEIELAALAMLLPAPSTPGGLTAQRFGDNRPPAVDRPASQSVRLRWDHPPTVQSYYVAKTAGGDLEPVNAERPAGGFEPILPAQEPAVDGDLPIEPIAFVDSESPVPMTGSAATTYAVIGADNMARWSQWATVGHTATAPSPTVPGLEKATLELADPPPADATIPGSLAVEFTWDFADRSPDRVELSARFAAPSTVPAPGNVSGFPPTATTAAGQRLIVAFDATGRPTVASAHDAGVTPIDQPVPPGETRRYRVLVRGLTLDFSTATELAVAVVGRGAERVRPGELSDPSPVVMAAVDDPRPPTVPAVPVDVLWTALPDATGIARAVLRWNPVPRAEGYVVWQATEAAVRAAVDQQSVPPPPGTGILTRVGELRTLITADQTSQARSLKAFTRLQDELIRETSLETELPARATSLFCYRISAVSASNVESARSEQVFIAAVPVLNTPGPPTLTARSDGAGAVEVTAVGGPGAPTAGYRLHRVQSRAAAESLGSMGPPVAAEDDTRWFDTTITSLAGTVTEAAALVDAVPPSWQPYRYRVVAVGQHDPDAGQIGGRSGPSGAQSALVAPGSPAVEISSVSPTGSGLQVLFTTDLPLGPTPVGPAAIAVSRSVLAGDAGRAEARPVVTVDPADVPAAADASVDDIVVRLQVLPDGTAGYSVDLPALGPDETGGGGRVTVTDPLGRSRSASFPEVP